MRECEEEDVSPGFECRGEAWVWIWGVGIVGGDGVGIFVVVVVVVVFVVVLAVVEEVVVVESVGEVVFGTGFGVGVVGSFVWLHMLVVSVGPHHSGYSCTRYNHTGSYRADPTENKGNTSSDKPSFDTYNHLFAAFWNRRL